MYRRKILSVVTATLLAGCGWSQERRDFDDETGPENGDSNENEANGDETETLPESDPGDTLIERDGEELLLPASEFISEWTTIEDWEENDAPTTNPCRKLEVAEFEYTNRECEYCVIVAESEDAAIDEFETFVSLSEKTKVGSREPLEQQDLDLQIGNEVAVYSGTMERGTQDRERLLTRVRIVFRDTNVVGTIDYAETTYATTDLEVRDTRDVVDLAVRMHEYWRQDQTQA